MRITGGCQCGAVRYALAEPPSHASVCHCRMCQKAGGGPFMAFGRVPIAALEWTAGAPAIFDSSSLARRGFCAACGTPLTYQYRDDAVSITLGSLDEPAAVRPELQYVVERRLPWLDDLAGLPARTADDLFTPELQAPLVNRQHPDHDA